MTIRWRAVWVGVFAFFLVGGTALAQEAPQDPPAESPDDVGADEAGPGDDVFIPTEEVPADEEITFPVNI